MLSFFHQYLNNAKISTHHYIPNSISKPNRTLSPNTKVQLIPFSKCVYFLFIAWIQGTLGVGGKKRTQDLGLGGKLGNKLDQHTHTPLALTKRVMACWGSNAWHSPSLELPLIEFRWHQPETDSLASLFSKGRGFRGYVGRGIVHVECLDKDNYPFICLLHCLT